MSKTELVITPCDDLDAVAAKVMKLPSKVFLDDGRELELLAWEPRLSFDEVPTVTLRATIRLPKNTE